MRSVPLRRILLPHDFSDYARPALAVADELAVALGAELRVVHVAARRLGLRTRGSSALLSFELTRGADELLHSLGELRARVSTSAAMLEGDVVAQLIQEACAWRADLLVMGTRGLRDRAGWGLGSVTAGLVRLSPCPVLAVPRTTPSDYRLRTILVPRELGDESGRPLDYAATLARATGARLLLLNVVEYFAEDTQPGELRVPELQLDLGARALQRLRRLLPEASDPGKVPELIVAPGRPQSVIPRLARERAADLLVLGFEPRRAIGRTLVGATLSHAAGSGACPVLAVPVP
jgi:nucleotide-binding universal stress UspA family protein